ncbi:type I-B CRISPR-associated protein Cas8b1/Cst1 [Thermanaerothrix sp. 4228-RoL]|uniref:Type I-B CRISPR-associated protein Cas8b1/Cst1 n=2 Tax=Thermanaerothrix TaxID=1077886 RepID=A0ABU3NL95_9CHLR|nr:type I-B CRISPR-associated protein Cas8b1/Cst1 [Thermanaerothrix sp. 4228-RoL]MDT8897616.1 type I-B CRISPR-associated protein Cas8b1/Cst1 [Thermanaerothrix sp. 4228-RoL]
MPEEMVFSLDYTGHPLLDVGLATLTAFADKKRPIHLTEDDLHNAAQYIRENYVVDPLKSFLNVAFPNSGFTNPAFEKQPEKRHKYAEIISNAFTAPVGEDRDPFTGLPATALPLNPDGDLPPGRTYRQHVPLLTGENVINFHPYGESGIPLSGISLLAFQMLPMGCAKVSGKLLAVHSDDPDLLLYFAKTFLKANLQGVTIARAGGEKKLPDTSPHRARTVLIEYLLDAEKKRIRLERETGVIAPTLTGYYFTNSGQGAELDIYPLPLEVSSFLMVVMHNDLLKPEWEALTARGWQLTRKEGEIPRYNRLYEDLFTLPEGAPRFIRLYFLRKPSRQTLDKQDPTLTYDTHREVNLISWRLTEIFLKKVMLMEESRIQSIRELGDALAQHVIDRNDRGVFNGFWMARNYGELRAVLIRASAAEVRAGRKPLITLDQFLSIFEQSEGVPNADWRLGRDLVLIRLLEQLYQKGWFQAHAEELPETTPEE